MSQDIVKTRDQQRVCELLREGWVAYGYYDGTYTLRRVLRATAREDVFLRALRRCWARDHQGPTARELAREAGYSAHSCAWKAMDSLMHKGLVVGVQGVKRTWQPVDWQDDAAPLAEAHLTDPTYMKRAVTS